MTRLRLKYVQAFGGYHYFRRAGSPRIRLPGLVGSSEFMAAYQAALATAPTEIGISRSKPGSVAAAVAALFGSERSFGSKAAGTRDKYRAVLESFRNDFGEFPMGSLPRKFIVALLDKKPAHTARTWLKALRCLCQFAVDHELSRDDPTHGIRIKLAKSDGHHCWTEEEISAFEGAHPIGTKARLALALGLYTIQRRGDVVKLGRQHIRGAWPMRDAQPTKSRPGPGNRCARSSATPRVPTRSVWRSAQWTRRGTEVSNPSRPKCQTH
jgi:hypothetical protein